MAPRTIRILILGDESVGKSTFISSLIGEKLPKYEKCFQPVVLPPSMCHGTKDIKTQLVDSNTGALINIEQQIIKSELILLFYDVTDHETVTRLSSYWMPMISKVRDNVPIIVVGNKLDRKDDPVKPSGYNATIKEVLKPIIRKFKQVEMGLECSALANRGVGSVLSCAQRSLLYPLAPLYNLAAKDLTIPFKKALVRIFRLLDKDGDGYLSDKEILQLQTRVFDSNLQMDDLKKLKEIVKVQLEQQDMNSISLDGFFTLNKKCVEMLAIHICWSILRHFGYTDQMRLTHLPDRFSFTEESGCSIELKQKPIFFLKRLFQTCSKGLEREKTSQKLVETIFFPHDGQVPIEQFVRVKEKIQLSDFIIAWHYLAYSNYMQCYKSLREIGYDGDLEGTFLMRPEKISLKDMSLVVYRNIISVGVYDCGGAAQKAYFDGLFAKSTDDFSIRRAHFIYSLPHGSKVIYIFRLNKDNISKFFYHHSNMLDIFVYFQSCLKDQKSKQALDMVPQWTMMKMITTQQSEQIGIQPLSESVNEQNRSGHKKHDYNKLFDLVWVTFKNPTIGYCPENLSRMKMLNHKTFFQPKNVVIMSSYLVALTVCGYFMLKKKNK